MGRVQKIRHVVSERDSCVFRNHMHTTGFESFNVSQKFRYHANKTFSSNLCFIRIKCLIRLTSSFLIENEWFEICLIHIISKNTKISFTSKVSYFKDTPVHCIVAWILFPEMALSDGPSF